ncbi:TniQ family protein [Thiohalorhabdus sp. Cl-TMA]|uniref:TniQ family protein n=1 Tax=Thiohalorhabdus methylotrophus TaxID=3242694 RepID=A0ABV4TS70_9GAMM
MANPAPHTWDGHQTLPIHLPPKTEEACSSWLTRLALAHGTNLRTLLLWIFGEKEKLPIDLEAGLGFKHIRLIGKATGFKPEEVSKTTLYNEQSSPNEIHLIKNWVLPNTSLNGLDRFPTFQFCPLCLTQTNEPYFLKKWRLSFYLVCPEHKNFLSSGCPHCYKNVGFQTSIFRAFRLNICLHCGKDITRKIEYTGKLDNSVYELLKIQESALKRVKFPDEEISNYSQKEYEHHFEKAIQLANFPLLKKATTSLHNFSYNSLSWAQLLNKYNFPTIFNKAKQHERASKLRLASKFLRHFQDYIYQSNRNESIEILENIKLNYIHWAIGEILNGKKLIDLSFIFELEKYKFWLADDGRLKNFNFEWSGEWDFPQPGRWGILSQFREDHLTRIGMCPGKVLYLSIKGNL